MRTGGDEGDWIQGIKQAEVWQGRRGEKRLDTDDAWPYDARHGEDDWLFGFQKPTIRMRPKSLTGQPRLRRFGRGRP